MSKVRARIILDAKSKEEKKSIFLAVTHERTTRQYSLGIDVKLTKDEFSNHRLKVTKEALELAEPYRTRAEKIIRELGDNFSLIRFSERFRGGTTVTDSSSRKICDIYNQYVNDHRSIHQGTADNYRTIVNHITQFKPGLRITDLDVDMILKLQDHIRTNYRREKGKELSEATMGIYMRALRALYNYAQAKFNLPRENYPFGKNRIVIHTCESSHRAMPDEDFNKFINYKPASKNEEFAHDMFFISLGLAGMNTADILNLKNKNIKSNNELEYVREKTKDRTTKRTVIKMIITTKVMALIVKYATLNPDAPEEYIFPFYNNIMTEKQKLRKRKDVNRAIDRSLKSICNNLGILPITTYWARHTIATQLYNAGQPLTVISKLLGHSSVTTTDTYLGQLGLDTKKEVATNVSSILEDLQI